MTSSEEEKRNLLKEEEEIEENNEEEHSPSLSKETDKYMSYGSTEEIESSSLIKNQNQNNQNTQNHIQNQNDTSIDNNEIKLHLNFIKKVYLILSFQLIVTTILCIVVETFSLIGFFVKINILFFIFFATIPLILVPLVLCFPYLARKAPLNYFLLIIFTFSSSYTFCYIALITSPRILLMSITMTSVMIIILTVYVCFTKIDFSMKEGSILIVGGALVLLGVFFFIFHVNILQVILSLGGVGLFSLYVIYDTLIMLESKKDMVENGDYVLASYYFYVDFGNAFIHLLKDIYNFCKKSKETNLIKKINK